MCHYRPLLHLPSFLSNIDFIRTTTMSMITCCRLIPAIVALTTGAAAYYLGKTSSDDRKAEKKHKRVSSVDRMTEAPEE